MLSSSAHALKTETVELERPDYITTVPEWFIYNGEKTIECLKALWDQGELENSVEFFDIYEDTIKNCILKDSESFRKTGLPDNSLDFAGQIKSSKIGGDDCERLAKDMLSHPPERLIQKSCLLLFLRSKNKRRKDTKIVSLHPVGVKETMSIACKKLCIKLPFAGCIHSTRVAVISSRLAGT